eukprot:CAMPEP_0197057212 /NCGR_PEP_ID=MMETSP1384-20130603/94292_1 /TAXON_ID=29189 /ORGANISM="Ammonia sp." /LENGTH=274 /DNA_ID=CAMNT_0042491529 /DNA_START=17 /DNA_END=841 /DNA_ORIENTATION=+
MATQAGTEQMAETDPLLRDSYHEQERRKYTGICASCQWFQDSPQQRWKFGFLLLFALLTPLWILLRLNETLTADIASGAVAFTLACYAANHFRLLLGLKSEIDEVVLLNKKHKAETQLLQHTVSYLQSTREELDGITGQLRQTHLLYQANLRKFKVLDERLRQFGHDSGAGIERLQAMSEHVADSFKKELFQHERNILMRVQEIMEFKDKEAGISESEYDLFLDALPNHYEARFRELGEFEVVSGGDGNINYQQFVELCDKFARDEAIHEYIVW